MPRPQFQRSLDVAGPTARGSRRAQIVGVARHQRVRGQALQHLKARFCRGSPVEFTLTQLHGLGFAGSLANARLPEHAALVGLLGFNVGVELGQLVLLAAAVAVISLVPRTGAARGRAATFSAYAIGATGAYLVLARSAFLFR